MDEFFEAFVAGTVGPPLGNLLSRFSLPAVMFIGLVVGLAGNVMFVAYEVACNGGFDAFMDTFRSWGGDQLSIALLIPLICIAGLTVSRLFNPPPAFEQAQVILDAEGYKKSVFDDGRRMEYSKDGVLVVFWHDRRYGRPRAEWWKDGRRRGRVLLTEPVY